MKQKSYKTTYIYANPTYFFTNAQIIDYELGINTRLSISSALDAFQQKQIPLKAVLSIFSLLVSKKANNQLQLQLNKDNIEKLIKMDLLIISVNCLKNYVNKISKLSENKQKNQESFSLEQQLILKGLFNIIYLLIYYMWDMTDKQQQLHQFIIKYQLDDLMMQMVGLSLEVHFVPMKKLTILYTIVLVICFHQKNNKTIYNDTQMKRLPLQNVLPQNYLQEKQLKNKRQNPIENFYKKHNIGDCPLAQYIVVGMLRSLLTICNSHTHKKFTTLKGSGVDAFRQWQISYVYALEKLDTVKGFLSNEILQRIKKYEQFNIQPDNTEIQGNNELFNQFYAHKIYTTSAITSFFMFLLISFKKNLFIQYSYFLQLISDANGILVFLKFLTDKFQNLDSLKSINLIVNQNQQLTFKEQIMLTIYNVLFMLYTSCNNYPEKIRNYLFQYNSYLIIKKIPRLFFPIIGQKTQQEILPSCEDINNNSIGILPQLTQLCYDLLKIQIPFFSKKMKDNGNNMKMIIQLYCRYPKKVQPIILTSFDKILIKNKAKHKEIKYVTNIDDLKNVHNEFNNLYYWTNDFVIDKSPKKQYNEEKEVIIDKNFDVSQWLQDNVWRYYD